MRMRAYKLVWCLHKDFGQRQEFIEFFPQNSFESRYPQLGQAKHQFLMCSASCGHKATAIAFLSHKLKHNEAKRTKGRVGSGVEWFSTVTDEEGSLIIAFTSSTLPWNTFTTPTQNWARRANGNRLHPYNRVIGVDEQVTDLDKRWVTMADTF